MPYVLVAYDVSCDKRRTVVREKLKAMGFSMVQKSVYLARGGSSTAKNVARGLWRMISHGEDSVLVLVVPREVLSKAYVLGCAQLDLDESSYVVV